MTRVCFRLTVAAELLPEYRRRHAAVWPDMLREIESAGRRNYSLFLAADGTLVGYYETDSVLAADRYLAASEVAATWEKYMGDLFDGLDGRADQAAEELDEVFHLEDQLAALETPTIAAPPTPAPTTPAVPTSHQGETA